MKSGNDVLKELYSDRTLGLSSEQVEVNREKFGRNEFSRGEKITVPQRIVAALKEPMIVLLLFATFLALVINVIELANGGHANIFEPIGIFVAVMISVVITVMMENHSAKAFDALNKINEDVKIKALRNGDVMYIPQHDIVVGDVLLVERGDKIPADGRLITSSSLHTDESSLTGESEHVEKDASVVLDKESTPVAERFNMLYSGTFITNGSGSYVVTAVGDSSEFGRIAKELSSHSSGNTPLQEKLATLGKRISLLATFIAVVVFAIQFFRLISQNALTLESVSGIFVTSIVLIVAAVPEGLPTIVAVALALNIIKMAKHNALVKKMVACETIGCINVICSDKTGTLTENKMTVVSAFDGKDVLEPNSIKSKNLVVNFAVNSTADVNMKDGKAVFVGNPTECALLTALDKSGMDYREFRSKYHAELIFTFTSETKNMTTVAEFEGEYTVYSKGSPEKILSLCDVTDEIRNDIEEKIAHFQAMSGRVIAFAHKGIDHSDIREDNRKFIESGLHYDGFVVIRDPLRQDVFDAVTNCRNAGIELKILTGDNIVTARAIASDLGIMDPGTVAIEAVELEKLDRVAFYEKIKSVRVIARSTPTIKMRVVNALKDMGNVVAVTGDGINDAPAIKNADVGLAMGITGTEVSKEASDIVLLDDSFSTIVTAVKWGRGIYENFQRFIQFQLTVNLTSVAVVLSAVFAGCSVPFTALQLLWINVIMDGPPALTLGLEPIQGNLMKRKPTKRDASIISSNMLSNIILNSVLMSVVFLLQYFTNFMSVEDVHQSGVLFSLFVVFQLFNAFNCRELGADSIIGHFLSNKPMLGVFATVFIVQVIIIQYAGAVFNVAPLSAITWLKVIATASSVVVFSEIMKVIRRHRTK